eukprot:scaffold23_cov101-Skeletonema_dohrnii-CCMP3373.AAC.10
MSVSNSRKLCLLLLYPPLFPLPFFYWSVLSRFGLTINNFDFCAFSFVMMLAAQEHHPLAQTIP